MKPGQILVRLDLDDLAWVDAQCTTHERTRPYVVARAIRFAKDNGLDLTSGEAKETQKSMKAMRSKAVSKKATARETR